MHLHFACSPSRIHVGTLIEAQAENLLFSYAFIKNPKKLAELIGEYKPKRILIDSGAFSVWSNGGSIDICAYAQFALDFQRLIDPSINVHVVNLDVLPGKWGEVPDAQTIAASAEQGWQNMLYLENKGLKVIHIFHQHEDFSILERLSKHSDYIGISPANDVSTDEKLSWLNKVFFYLKDSTKCHGFAVTSHRQLFGYPFYSVDSSSWITPARFGRIPILTDQNEVKTLSYKDEEGVEKYWPYLRHIGIHKIADIADWGTRVLIGIRTYQKLEKIATTLWTSRGVIWKD